MLREVSKNETADRVLQRSSSVFESVDRGGLPTFIIVGAQKCGTSSLHAVLAEHQDVFIPNGEIFFFDVDDIEQHPDFFIETRKGWTHHDLEAQLSTYLDWYRGFFGAAGSARHIGEDSTTYLASRLAPRRIKAMLPDVKLIAMLRDPVKRAQSHYWHRVGTGRATTSFEEVLRHSGHSILDKGKYDQQLARYLEHFHKESLHVVLFDDFVSNPQGTMDRVCDFLDLSRMNLNGIDTHRNAARPPLWAPGRLLYNKVLSGVARKSYAKDIPNMPGYVADSARLRFKHSEWSDRLNEGLTSIWPRKKYPPMKAATREFLEKIFRPHVERLSTVLDRDLIELWGYRR